MWMCDVLLRKPLFRRAQLWTMKTNRTKKKKRSNGNTIEMEKQVIMCCVCDVMPWKRQNWLPQLFVVHSNVSISQCSLTPSDSVAFGLHFLFGFWDVSAMCVWGKCGQKQFFIQFMNKFELIMSNTLATHVHAMGRLAFALFFVGNWLTHAIVVLPRYFQFDSKPIALIHNFIQNPLMVAGVWLVCHSVSTSIGTATHRNNWVSSIINAIDEKETREMRCYHYQTLYV